MYTTQGARRRGIYHPGRQRGVYTHQGGREAYIPTREARREGINHPGRLERKELTTQGGILGRFTPSGRHIREVYTPQGGYPGLYTTLCTQGGYPGLYTTLCTPLGTHPYVHPSMCTPRTSTACTPLSA